MSEIMKSPPALVGGLFAHSLWLILLANTALMDMMAYMSDAADTANPDLKLVNAE